MLFTYGASPLFISLLNDKYEIFRYLLPLKYNVNKKAKKDITLLHIAVEKGNLEIVKLLVELGAQVNDISDIKYSALIIACQNEHYEICKYLIENGADVNQNLCFDANLTPLYFARLKNNNQIVQLLLDNGAKEKPDPVEPPSPKKHQNNLTNNTASLTEISAGEIRSSTIDYDKSLTEISATEIHDSVISIIDRNTSDRIEDADQSLTEVFAGEIETNNSSIDRNLSTDEVRNVFADNYQSKRHIYSITEEGVDGYSTYDDNISRRSSVASSWNIQAIDHQNNSSNTNETASDYNNPLEYTEQSVPDDLSSHVVIKPYSNSHSLSHSFVETSSQSDDSSKFRYENEFHPGDRCHKTHKRHERVVCRRSNARRNDSKSGSTSKNDGTRMRRHRSNVSDDFKTYVGRSLTDSSRTDTAKSDASESSIDKIKKMLNEKANSESEAREDSDDHVMNNFVDSIKRRLNDINNSLEEASRNVSDST